MPPCKSNQRAKTTRRRIAPFGKKRLKNLRVAPAFQRRRLRADSIAKVARARGVVLLAVLALGAACPKRHPPESRHIDCFDVTATANSPGTRALFEKRRCQGGGVTWSALLQVVAARQGRVASIEEPVPGWTGDVSTLDGRARFSVDDEGDAARFCADDAALLATVRAQLAHLNSDARELARAMGEAKAYELECTEADGTPPKLPPLAPPAPAPESLAATRAALGRLKQVLARQPIWCFPPDDYARRTGALRFLPDGSVTWTATTGEIVGRGRALLPREELEDERIEVNLQRAPGARSEGGSALEHFDLGNSGRLGFDLIGEEKTTRSEMIPGDGCLKTPAKH
jgi:hypothetical protein